MQNWVHSHTEIAWDCMLSLFIFGSWVVANKMVTLEHMRTWKAQINLYISAIITKTGLYIFHPLKSHFYIVKLGFTGVYIIFLISAQKHRLWVLVRTASTRRFKRVPIIYVSSRNLKNIRVFCMKIFSFWRWNFLYIWIGVFSLCLPDF